MAKTDPGIDIAIEPAKLNRQYRRTMELVDQVALDTNIDSGEFMQMIGGRASTSAAAATTTNLSPRKFQSRTPAKLFYRKLVAQTSVKKYLDGGVWYVREKKSQSNIGEKKKTKRRRKPDPKLSQFAKKRRKKRKDPTAPFKVPAPIRNAKKKGLRKVKMLLRLTGKGQQRRDGRFWAQPRKETSVDKSKRDFWISNTGAAKLGWLKAPSKMRHATSKDKKQVISERTLANHRAVRQKTTVKYNAPSAKKGAGIAITNKVSYTKLSHVGDRSNRIGMHKAMNWFEGFWWKRQRTAERNYRQKYGDVL